MQLRDALNPCVNGFGIFLCFFQTFYFHMLLEQQGQGLADDTRNPLCVLELLEDLTGCHYYMHKVAGENRSLEPER